ncbi:hypothetical protein [Clostridium oceanicum]|uniref:DUF5067 domain-containing protein n=1 Tax=Clostridium oceanicum TaxID=1543 RepID=A0ABP3UM06_9CLOT
MKKLLITIILVLTLISLIGCGSKNENKNSTKETKTVSQQNKSEKNKEIEESKQEVVDDNKNLKNNENKNKPIEPKDHKSEIKTSIKDTFNNGDYTNAKLTSITINENLGTDVSNDYIALVYLKFDIKNRRKTGNKVMRMYSDDLVAKLADQGITDISEAAIFWEDEYNSRSVKYAYEYKNKGFYIMDVAGE